MLKLIRHTRRELITLMWTVAPFTLLLNCVLFGGGYFSNARLFLFSTPVTFLILSGNFFLYRHIAVIFRHRFPEDEKFFKRTLVLILLFLLMSALILFGIFSLYIGVGLLDNGSYENRFTWAYIITGILNVFFTFLYEGLFRFESWKSALTETEMLKIAYKQSQLMGLKSQVNPHFLFNSLNSLSGLIQEDTERAERFLDEMSRVYRYMLRNDEEQLVPLSVELQFIQSYFSLLKARYNEAIMLRSQIRDGDKEKFIAPLSLQVIIENALFQNRTAKDSPLQICIESWGDSRLRISNNVQRKVMSEEIEYEAGLDNLVKKYQLMSQRPVEIEEMEAERHILLPLISKEGEVPL